MTKPHFFCGIFHRLNVFDDLLNIAHMKPDKLPTLDPNVRGIFDLIVRTVVEIRKERQSQEYRQAEKRREESAVAVRKLKEFDAQAEAYREEQERRAALLR